MSGRAVSAAAVLIVAVALVLPAQAPAPAHAPPVVALTALTAPAGPSPDVLLREQIGFHLDLAVNFIVTGAALTGRILPVPATLIRAVSTGTPAPIALRDAVVTLADVEFDAGRHLVGYARDYATFQVRFVTGLLAALPGPAGALFATAGAAAVAFVQWCSDAAVRVVTGAQTVLHRTLGAPAVAPRPVRAAPTIVGGDRPVLTPAATRITKPHVAKHDSAPRLTRKHATPAAGPPPDAPGRLRHAHAGAQRHHGRH